MDFLAIVLKLSFLALLSNFLTDFKFEVSVLPLTDKSDLIFSNLFSPIPKQNLCFNLKFDIISDFSKDKF